MSEPRSLPRRPSVHALRAEAAARRRSGEFGSDELARLAVAREHGFVSWPRLVAVPNQPFPRVNDTKEFGDRIIEASLKTIHGAVTD